MSGIRWTNDEEDFLENYYGKLNRAEIESGLPDRSWDSIKLHAAKLKLKFNYGVHKLVQSNLEPLLLDHPLTYYWIGFLMADGHFGSKRISLVLAKKDKEHIEAFAEFIKCPNVRQEKRSYSIKAQDRITVPKIIQKFKLSNRKTYNPPDLSWIGDQLFVSLAIGFIDGDGSIGKQSGRQHAICRIKVHRSWLANLRLISNRLCGLAGCIPAKAKINKQGYAEINFSNSVLLRYLKKKTIELELPVLKRKWDKIDENFVPRTDPTFLENRLSNVQILLKDGIGPKDIAVALCLSTTTVYATIKKHNLKKKEKLCKQ
jgi:hypothetical protein